MGVSNIGVRGINYRGRGYIFVVVQLVQVYDGARRDYTESQVYRANVV